MTINFRVYYPKNSIFRFLVNYNWSESLLYSLRESIGYSGFKHEHMEDWVNRAHKLWETKDEQ